MRSPLARAVAYSVFILLGLLSALPNVLPDSVLQKLPSWYAANTITLGLDLRGGSVVRDKCGTPLIKLDRLLRQMHFQTEPELVMVTDYYEPKSEPEGAQHFSDHSAAYAHAVHVAEITVDTLTGEYRVERVDILHDVGSSLNPAIDRGQIENVVDDGQKHR